MSTIDEMKGCGDLFWKLTPGEKEAAFSIIALMEKDGFSVDTAREILTAVDLILKASSLLTKVTVSSAEQSTLALKR